MNCVNLPKYTDYDTIFHAFQASVNHHKDKPFIHYQSIPGSSEFKTLTYGEVDIMTTYLANEWGPILVPTINGKDNPPQCVATLGHESPVQSILMFFTILKLGLPNFPILSNNTTEEVVHHTINVGKPGYLIASEIYFKTALHSSTTITTASGSIIPVKIWKEYDIDYLVQVASKSAIEGQQLNMRHVVPTGPDSTVMVFITGGSSTGLPKAIARNNRSFLYCLIETTLKNIDTIISNDSKTSLNHGQNRSLELTDVWFQHSPMDKDSSYYFLLLCMIIGTRFLVFQHYPSSPTWHEILVELRKFKVAWMLSYPPLLDQLSYYLQECTSGDSSNSINNTSVAALKELKGCFSGGAPLRPSTEKILKSHNLNLISVFASSEIGVWSVNCLSDTLGANDFAVQGKDLRYLSFEPFYQDIRQLVVSGDCPGLAINDKDRSNGDFATGDLFITSEEHKTQNIWTYVGRVNSVLTLENGYKVCPLRMELEVYYEEIIHKCIVIGEGRKCTAMLVELVVDKAIKYSPTTMITKVYEAVRRANKCVPSHYAVMVPDMVYILPLNKRLPLTGKGVVFQPKVFVEFQQEIKQLYKNCSNTSTAVVPDP